MEQFTNSDLDGGPLVVNLWDSKTTYKGVIQIAHGAAEHLGRYDRLARFLNRRGYAALGADHRGHGANIGVDGPGHFGPRGFAGIVDDMRLVSETARDGFPGLPLILLAHSFGSFAAQVYLMKHADLIDGLVLSGTAAVDLLLAGADLGSGLTSANAQFEPARTPFDWLSRDEREVDAYVADPLCGFELEPRSLMTMAEVVAGAAQAHDLSAAAAKATPIYVISGEHDPIVGPGQCLSRALVDRFREAGIRDVEHRIYAGGRHEMFNETNRDEVMADLANWLDARFGP
jgi:alpha-beta hydrolase superfamily lysophospholipase